MMISLSGLDLSFLKNKAPVSQETAKKKRGRPRKAKAV